MVFLSYPEKFLVNEHYGLLMEICHKYCTISKASSLIKPKALAKFKAMWRQYNKNSAGHKICKAQHFKARLFCMSTTNAGHTHKTPILPYKYWHWLLCNLITSIFTHTLKGEWKPEVQEDLEDQWRYWDIHPPAVYYCIINWLYLKDSISCLEDYVWLKDRVKKINQ